MYPTPSATRCSATASLSSQVSEMPTCCDPSRSVVSYSTTSRPASYGNGTPPRARRRSRRGDGRAVLRVNGFLVFLRRPDRPGRARREERAGGGERERHGVARECAHAWGAPRGYAGESGAMASLFDGSDRKSNKKPPFSHARYLSAALVQPATAATPEGSSRRSSREPTAKASKEAA